MAQAHAPERSTLRTSWEPLGVPRAEQRFVHATGDPFESRDPATGETVASIAASTSADLDAALASARAAARGAWRSSGALRAGVLHRFAAALEDNGERLAELLTREQGKPITEARLEIAGSAEMVGYYAGLARAVYGRSIALGESSTGVILREPVGVVAVITPWNWPITLLVRSLAPALAAGNACVVKPASLTAAVSVEVLDLLASDPELPGGVLTAVLGSGSVVGEALVAHREVDMIAFTGESVTGTRVMRSAAEGTRRVALELGGKSPNVVFADADLDKAAAGAANAIFTTCGQICTAGSRLLVEEPVYEELVSRICDRARSMEIGDGLAEGVELGPMVSEGQLRTVLDYVELGRAEGEVLAGGARPEGTTYERGHFVQPTVLAGLPDGSRLLREEIFGPVLAVQPFADEEQAVAMANDSEYGLAAGLWTSDLNRAWRVGSALEAGTVWINTYHHFYDEAEVGGFKRSGVGRQQGIDGLHEFTETKHLNFDRSPTLW